MSEDVLILRERATGYWLRINMKYQKININNGIIQNKLTPRELSFVKANLPKRMVG